MTKSADERTYKLHNEVAKAIKELPGDRHIHAATEFAVTLFEVRHRTDREYWTIAIDDDGEFHTSKSTLED